MSVTVDMTAYKKLLKKLKAADVTTAKVGVLSAKGGSKTRESGISMVELAAVHEFGSPKNNIPERSFIRSTFDKSDGEFKKVIAKVARKLIEDAMTVRQAHDIVGAWGANAVKKSITEGSGIPPANKPATVRRKGSSRPLVDTGRLVNSISWVVK